MGMSSKLVKGLAIAALLCLGSLQAAKADMLPTPSSTNGSTITYLDVPVSYVQPTDGNSPAAQYCGGCVVDETVVFTNVGGAGGVGIEVGTLPSSHITEGSTSDVNYNCSSPSCLLATTSPYWVNFQPSSTGIAISSSLVIGSASGTYDTNPGDQLCVLNAGDTVNSCLTNIGAGGSQTAKVTYASGIFTVTDLSLGVAFSFSTVPVSTPEASSVLTLTVGLLGLLGFGLLRKRIA